jgi:hypothetical protein
MQQVETLPADLKSSLPTVAELEAEMKDVEHHPAIRAQKAQRSKKTRRNGR